MTLQAEVVKMKNEDKLIVVRQAIVFEAVQGLHNPMLTLYQEILEIYNTGDDTALDLAYQMALDTFASSPSIPLELL